MDTKHTPGPWVATFSFSGLTPGIGDTWQIDCDNHAVCTTQFCYAPNTEANARLIAAAPELLEALKECHRALMHYEWYANPASGWAREDNDFVRYMTDAAIAKATGQ